MIAHDNKENIMPRIRRKVGSFLDGVQNAAIVKITDSAPTTAWINFNIGDVIVNKTTRIAYMLMSKETGVASWEAIVGDAYDYQESILKQCAVGDATETEGNRYLASATGGAWTETYIYEFSSGEWVEFIPSKGCLTYDENTSGYLLFDGSSWGSFTTGITTIAAATDVTITTAAEANVLVFDTTWKNQAISGDVSLVKGGGMTVTDLTIASEAQGDILRRNATSWGRLAAKTDKQILIGDGTDITSVAISGDIAITNLGAVTVTDLTLTSEAQGTIAQFDGTNWVVLPVGTVGQSLLSGGIAAANYWGAPSIASASLLANGCVLSDAGANDATLVFTTQTVATAALTIPDVESVADTFVFTTLAQTLASKTLTTPKIVTTGAIHDDGGNAYLTFVESATPRDSIQITQGDAAVGATIASITDDTNANLNLSAAGTGDVAFLNGTEMLAVRTTNNLLFTFTDQATAESTCVFPSQTNASDTVCLLAETQALTNKTITAGDINGGTIDNITSFGIRSTGAAFDLKFATTEAIAADRTVTWNVGNAARSITLGGDISTGGALTTLGDFIQTGVHNIGLTTTGATAITLPTAGIVVATAAAATNGQLIVGSTGVSPVSATVGHSGGTLTSTLGAGTLNIDTASSMIQTATIEISNAQLKALNGTPIQLVAAPGADKFVDFLGAVIGLNYATAAMDDPTGDGDIQIRYDAGTVASLTVEAAGFIDAAANAATTCKPLATDVIIVANKKLELYNDAAEYTSGGGSTATLTVCVNYRVLDLS